MLSILTLLLACGDKPEPTDTGTEPVEDTAVVDVCSETALGAFASDVEWITLHGNSIPSSHWLETMLSLLHTRDNMEPMT